MMDEERIIMVLDDENDVLELVGLHLRKAGYRALTFNNVPDFWRELESVTPALIVLDIMLPVENGLVICKKLRQNERYKHIPVIMLTALDRELERIDGLDTGADDYMTKPFSPDELVARIRAILRRMDEAPHSDVLDFGELHIDLTSYEVSLKKRAVPLTATEFRLLSLLAGKRGRVYTREQILDYLWGDRKIVIDRTVDVHIKNLREKLGDAGKCIRNVRGIGYKFNF